MKFRGLATLLVVGLAMAWSACDRRHNNDDFSPTASGVTDALMLSVPSSSIPADGFSRIAITARITAEAVSTRRRVRFQTTDGQFIDPDTSPADGKTKTADADPQGVVSVELRSGTVPKVATITAQALDTGTNTEVAGLLARMTIEFTPPDPVGVIRVSTSTTDGEADNATQIFVHADIGPGLPEGARTVTFETTLGTFVSGTPVNNSMTMVTAEADRSNRATVALKSPDVAGRARITAKVSQTTSETFLQFSPALPDIIIVNLEETKLTRGGTEETDVMVNLHRNSGRGSVTKDTIVTYSAVDRATGRRIDGFSFRDQVPSDMAGLATAKLLLGSVEFVGTATIRARVGNVTGEEDIDIEASGRQPDISVMPGRRDFGSVMVGESSERTVTIRNEGSAPLTVRSLTCTGDGFTLVNPPPLPSSIAPGDERLILMIKFTPAAAGTQNGALMIASDDPDEGSVMVTLTGVGQASTP